MLYFSLFFLVMPSATQGSNNRVAIYKVTETTPSELEVDVNRRNSQNILCRRLLGRKSVHSRSPAS